MSLRIAPVGRELSDRWSRRSFVPTAYSKVELFAEDLSAPVEERWLYTYANLFALLVHVCKEAKPLVRADCSCEG
jgi:hypothetical protein